MTTNQDNKLADFDLRELRPIDRQQGGLPPDQYRIHDQDIVIALEEDKALESKQQPLVSETAKEEEEDKGNMLE